MFVAPWVLIAEDNSSPARARSLSAARSDLATGAARSIAGRVRPGVLAADIDPQRGYAIAGDACAESLVKWCERERLPYLVRESGRPGGRHVVTVAGSRRHRRQWQRLCARLSRQFDVEVDDRTGKTLRLLTSPHRQGLPCPVLACTLTPSDVTDRWVGNDDSARAAPAAGSRRPRGTGSRAGARDNTRSGKEFGRACAMVRSEYDAADAWRAIAVPGSKACALGRRWWQRYEWLPAVTAVAAERSLPESDAWALARAACPPKYGYPVRHRWWLVLWRKALAEAATDRPRRIHCGDNTVEPSSDPGPEIEALRAELESVSEEVLPGVPMRPQRRASIARMLFHLAGVLVTRDGSISQRDLAERTLMDRRTLQAAMAVCLQVGLLVVTRRYRKGTNDCAAYGVGPEVVSRRADRETSPTSCSTPSPGRASLLRLRAEHAADRLRWALRCDALARLLPGERLATSKGRSAKLLRSLHHQRQWLRTLDAAQLAARQALRRRLLRGLDPAIRNAWLNWLEFRRQLVESVDRLHTNTYGDDDLRVIESADDLVHRGLRDARWQQMGGSRAA
ncbi:hypothetical protein ACWDOP_00885 [Nocardia sp. NPDC003693]